MCWHTVNNCFLTFFYATNTLLRINDFWGWKATGNTSTTWRNIFIVSFPIASVLGNPFYFGFLKLLSDANVISAGAEVAQKKNPNKISFSVYYTDGQSQLIKAEIKAQHRSGEFNQEVHFLIECHRCLFSLLEFSTTPQKP